MVFSHILLNGDGDPLCCAMIGLLVGLGAMLNGVYNYLLLQKIKNTPTSKVRSAAVGLVELYGTAVCDKELYSPISGAKCVYYAVGAEYYRSGKHGGWVHIFDDRRSNPFYLQDETGKMLIDPAGAIIVIPLDKEYNGYISGKGIFGMPHKQIEPAVIKFIENADERTRKSFMNHKNEDIRVREYYIEEGDKVYVLGSAEPIPGKASHIAHENLVVKKGKHDNIMYISDTHESNVTKSLESSVLWGLFGGLALAAFGLALIFWRIGIL